MTIYATWSRDKERNVWLLRVPKDKLWGEEEPHQDDEVTAIKRDGTFRVTVLGDFEYEDYGAWYFSEMSGWDQVGEDSEPDSWLEDWGLFHE